MVSLVTLHIEGHPEEKNGFKVSSFSFNFSQIIDQTGRPQGRVSGGVINVSVKNLNDFDIFSWLFSQNAQKKGKIVLSSVNTKGKSFQVVNFVDGLLVNYSQFYNENAELIANLTISCKEIDISGARFLNIWTAQ